MTRARECADLSPSTPSDVGTQNDSATSKVGADSARSSRRRFLALGGALLATGGCAHGTAVTRDANGPKSPPTRAENLAVWKRNAGVPYKIGTIRMPGVLHPPRAVP